jgi:hypothetical protein
MNELTFTLVTDGSSDDVLLPILTWLLRVNGVTMALQPVWADLRRAYLPRRADLTARLRAALHLFPCDLLFVHRDAEREPRERRVAEIRRALDRLPVELRKPKAICVVPVRMQEAWLLARAPDNDSKTSLPVRRRPGTPALDHGERGAPRQGPAASRGDVPARR